MKQIPLMLPDIGPGEIEAVVSVLQSGNLVQGEKVQALEKSIASYIGVEHAIAVSSGTATLHLALVALGIGPGDEVIVPALSFVATANAVELVGAKPVFVDVCLDDFNINVQKIEESITTRTKAIMPVHEFGLACNMDEIMAIANKHKLWVIEDAACALGATIHELHVGTIGSMGSFSFHPRKAITSGEGGLLVTNNHEWASKIRILRNHGIELIGRRVEFVMAGFNYRMTDFQAALVQSQFQRIESVLERKEALANVYLTELKSFDAVRLPKTYGNKRHTWQSFHIVLDDGIDRDRVIERMRENGVATNYGAQCIPNQHFYQNKYGYECKILFPNALRANLQGLVLPLYGQLHENDIHRIISLLKQIVN